MVAANIEQLLASITCPAHHASETVERYTREQSTVQMPRGEEKKGQLKTPVGYTIGANTSSKTFKTPNSGKTLVGNHSA